jgi:hypothetical protein
MFQDFLHVFTALCVAIANPTSNGTGSLPDIIDQMKEAVAGFDPERNNLVKRIKDVIEVYTVGGKPYTLDDFDSVFCEYMCKFADELVAGSQLTDTRDEALKNFRVPEDVFNDMYALFRAVNGRRHEAHTYSARYYQRLAHETRTRVFYADQKVYNHFAKCENAIINS